MILRPSFVALVALLVSGSTDGIVDNPYLQEFRAAGITQGSLQPLRNDLEQTLPQPYLDLRWKMVARYSWAVPTDSAIRKVVSHSRRILDVGAGTGYWAYLLKQAGADVIAIDNWADGHPRKLWHPVQTGDHREVAKHSGRALMMVWPPRNSMPTEALSLYRGTMLIYIGEWCRGSGDPRFYQTLAAEWRLIDYEELPRWKNRSDRLFIFERGPPDLPRLYSVLVEEEMACT